VVLLGQELTHRLSWCGCLYLRWVDSPLRVPLRPYLLIPRIWTTRRTHGDTGRAGRGAMKQWMTHAYIGKSWRRNGRLCMHGCRCKYGSRINGDQPQPLTTLVAMCTQPKPSLRCMDASVSTNIPAWSVNYFYLMVMRRCIKYVHLPDLFLSDGSIEGRH